MPARIESRRIQVVKSTYLVSLPSEWANAHSLQQSDLIDVVIFGEDDDYVSLVPQSSSEKDFEKFAGSLLLSPKEFDSVSLDRETEAFRQSADKIIRKIVACYLIGYNDIFLVNAEEKREKGIPLGLVDELKTFVYTRLLDVDLSVTPNELLFHVRPSQISVEESLREMCEALRRMGNQVEVLIGRFDKGMIDEIGRNDSYVDRLHKYIVRTTKQSARNPVLLVKLGMDNPRQLWGYRMVSKRLELIGDSIQAIGKEIDALSTYGLYLNQLKTNQIESICAKTLNLCREVVEAIAARKHDFDMANEIIEKATKLKTEAGKTQDTYAMLTTKNGSPGKKAGKLDISEARLNWGQGIIIMKIQRICDYIVACAEIIMNIGISSKVLPYKRS